jgi:DNA-binding transcriptional LysR family regulator
MEIMVRVADSGSFSRAARALGITPSAISHAVAEMEAELRQPLFYRTTRRLRLTPEGEIVSARARGVLEQVAVFDAAVARPTGRLQGVLRIGLSISISRMIVMPAIARFLQRHAELQLDFRIITQMTEMDVEGVDLMLRVGEMPEARVVARHIASLRFGVYAAPGYLARAGEPRKPADLREHACLVFRDPRYARLDEWTFERGNERETVKIDHPVVVSDDRDGVHAAIAAGAGIGRVSAFNPDQVTSGRLRRLLPEWNMPGGFPVYAIYRRAPKIAPKIAAFLDFAAAAFASFDVEEFGIVHVKGFTGARSG